MNKLLSHINSHDWWRTALPDDEAIKARGMFYMSSFKDAEFYGRPIDTPFKVKVTNPLFGDEAHIIQTLGMPELDYSHARSLDERFALDAEMKRSASAKRYDSIALGLTESLCRLQTDWQDATFCRAKRVRWEVDRVLLLHSSEAHRGVTARIQ